MENRKASNIVTTLSNVGAFLREKGFIPEAISCFLALSTDDETFGTGDYAFEIGLCHLKMGDMAQAKHYFSIALRENPPVYSYKLQQLNL